MLVWLWAVPALALLAVMGIVRSRALFARFAERVVWNSIAGEISLTRRVVKWALSLAALALVVIALAQPQWNPKPREIRRLGRDVCFVIDVSRSMLAEDLAPNRLERAKLWVRDVMRQVKGDRIAIVAFAGNAIVTCPLTHDYGYAMTALEEVSPASVSRGGTLIGDAVRIAANQVFDPKEASFKDVILITDGEDHESFPVEAAKAAGEQGVRIIAIGIGDENEGRPIPFTDDSGRRRYVEYQGQRVMSKLDADTLREMARVSNGGVYFNVATGDIELDRVYKDLITSAEQREFSSDSAVQYEEKFQIFLGLALGLLVTERLISEKRRG